MRPIARDAATRGGVEEAFRSAVARHGMIRPGDRVLAGISGGGDSVLLLHLLAAHRARLPFTLHIAHLNHGLRGAESDADEAFVRELAGRLSLPIACGRADLARAPGASSSIEERARIARRSFLKEAAREAACGRIALGHTLDDQVETILMWLIRGTGRGGLSGMEPVTGDGVVRPLLGVRRRQAREHLRAMGEPFREDSTNDDPSRLRNRIRRLLVPLLDREFEGSADTIASEAAILAAEDEHLEEAARALLGAGRGRIAIAAAASAPRALARRMVRLASEEAGMPPRSLERAHVEAVLGLAAPGMDGKGVDLPAGFRAGRRGGEIVFEAAAARAGGGEAALEHPGRGPR